MQMSFPDSAYSLALIDKNFSVLGNEGVINLAKTTAQFSYSDLSKEEFNQKYFSDGWSGRKIEALYMGFWTGVIQTLYQLSKAVFARLNASISSNNDDESKFKLHSLKHFYTSARDIQEGFGWVVTLFNDSYGTYHVQEARFHKACYEYFEQKINIKPPSPVISPPIAPELPPAPPKSSPVADPIAEMLASRREETEKIKCPIARETGRATTEGFYMSLSGKKIPLRSGAELLEGTHVFPNTIIEYSVESKHEEFQIVVNDRDCLEAAEEEIKNGAKKVAVLMFASPIEPGGAMEEGNNGQEEDLCRRSNLFGFMWDQARWTAKTPLYNLVDVNKPHQVDPQYTLMKNNKMIHVPQVTVFRSGKKDDYKVLENPFEVGMLVSPALDRPRYEIVNGKMCYQRKEDEEQLLKLVTTQLKVAYDQNYDTVILGAFGCGAFYNPPEIIAEFYKKTIDAHFKGAFKKIVFAILDDPAKGKHNPEGNLKPFQKCFDSYDFSPK